ncbi:MAG: hypothetical protein COA78_21145 [Blastopirellula sp.]|nr:MAG: hypothetical protein COA78_21145 [Blastopirellula sp.]
MATIVNNSQTADESILRIHNPIMFVPDPDKGKPLDGFQAFFGLVGRDPQLEQNRKIVYALQEDGTAVPLDQPVIGSAGGVPMYNGSPVGLAVSGSYSLKILDKNGAQTYNIPEVAALNLQGFSGVIAEESTTVDGSLVLDFTEIEVTSASFYKSTDSLGTIFEGSYLKKDVDYVSNNTGQITLLQATAIGTVILGRQMDSTGQIVPVTEGSSALFVFEDIATAVAADLQSGDTLTINGGVAAQDKLGGAKYLTVLGQPETPDGENVINLSNGNQIQALENTFKLARYSEVTTVATSVAGALNLDLNQGNVFTTTLFENIGNINFVNLNPDSDLTTTISLEIIQDAATPRTVSFGGVIFSGGVIPTMSTGLGSTDDYVFKLRNGIAKGGVFGQDFS